MSSAEQNALKIQYLPVRNKRMQATSTVVTGLEVKNKPTRSQIRLGKLVINWCRHYFRTERCLSRCRSSSVDAPSVFGSFFLPVRHDQPRFDGFNAKTIVT